MSNAGTLFLNTAMLKELTGKIDQVACVVAHEIAHITQNHGEEKKSKQIELDQKTSVRVSPLFRKQGIAECIYCWYGYSWGN